MFFYWSRDRFFRSLWPVELCKSQFVRKSIYSRACEPPKMWIRGPKEVAVHPKVESTETVFLLRREKNSQTATSYSFKHFTVERCNLQLIQGTSHPKGIFGKAFSHWKANSAPGAAVAGTKVSTSSEPSAMLASEALSWNDGMEEMQRNADLDMIWCLIWYLDIFGAMVMFLLYNNALQCWWSTPNICIHKSTGENQNLTPS